MQEPSHLPCPMCGKPEKTREEKIQEEVDQAINNLKFMNLGYILAFHMSELERKVFYFYQIQKKSFKEIAVILSRKEGTVRSAWQRCKTRGDKALQDSVDQKVIIPPYI
jgi:hypothetical protein